MRLAWKSNIASPTNKGVRWAVCIQLNISPRFNFLFKIPNYQYTLFCIYSQFT